MFAVKWWVLLLLLYAVGANQHSCPWIMQYNVFEGQGMYLQSSNPVKLERLGKFLAKQPHDVVCMNECNKWDAGQASLKVWAPKWGFPYVELLVTRTGFHIAIISKSPLTLVEGTTTGFHHGLLHVRTDSGVNIFATHASPLSVGKVKAEMQRVAEAVQQVGDAPALVLGDLNALSPVDAALHKSGGLAMQLRSLSRPRRKFMTFGQLDYSPMQTLLDAGLVDPIRTDQQDRTTVPTAIRVDKTHSAPMRLDFILANRAYMARYRPVAQVLKGDPGLDTLSDHFPVELRC
eukprot:GGOE01044889.1.p1 GENE.GGOE01044889.1~~GGOE01044889.1.p1  ORF type:complete len:290 (-),score=83.06 GGOE01044889.1:153-1022(-)